ncbi:hypothetical protein [Mangrovimonas sp. YM274]|uniref:hypothetical protein n=1 Tax=Mangrovimonas sp. YM274 TaxID=3070660 RepID=UPI0027DD823F|nr:hypothetical protein [Mangrovimonas sp. YM274]WMI67709.1 hypothetical protein RBH95_11215 [Mangrovimonas sp. YM274]
MTKNLALSLLCLFTVFALQAQSEEQLKKIKKIEAKIWSKRGPYNDVFDIPEKWQNESAVYIVRSVDYYYIRPQNSIEYTKLVRNRIKLLDQAAVTEYSEFKYKNDNQYRRIGTSVVTNTFYLGVKVIKPNGEEYIVNTKEEIIEGDDERKIAIPNLEKGDIIDYYFYTDMIPGENDLYRFKSVEGIVEANYPIMNYDFKLHTEKDFFISFNTYNEAPELEKYPATGKKGRDWHYGFKMKDVEENTYPRWFYPYLELPCYKFNVTFARTRGNQEDAYAFIPAEDTTIKKKVSQEEVFEFYESRLAPDGKLKDVKKYINDHDFKSNAEKVKSIFYYMRHAYLTKYIEAIVMDEAKIINFYQHYDNFPTLYKSEERFMRYFTNVLKDEKIDYDILVGTKRYNGTIDELLLEHNTDFVLKINTETPVYIDLFNAYAMANNISPLLENSKAYALKVEKRKNIEGIEQFTFPSTTYQANNSKEVMEVSFKEDFMGLQMNRVSTHTGHNKTGEQENRLEYFDFIYEDHDKYETLPILKHVRNKKNRTRLEKEYAALLKKLKEKQQETCKKSTANEYALELDEYNFEVINTGRFDISDPLSFKENFTTKGDLIKKAGPNYIFNVGKLIGSQFEINDKTRARTHNVYLGNPRSFTNEINIAIPDGFEVTGLEKLNYHIENETGAFISTANIEGNTLTIKTEKVYKNYFEPNANWNMMVEFLEAANDFEEAKILLKRNNS